MPNSTLLENISYDLDMPVELLLKIVARAPHTYKSFNIPKKNGELRNISQPARETKYLQYWLMDNVFKELPVHECATAYKKGANIKSNAIVHVENSYIVKYDFRSFFTSIKARDVLDHLARYLGNQFSEEDLKIIARIACKHTPKTGDCLSIGAPSSPLISNSIMYSFDSTIADWCQNNNFEYTRYADDLTFSTSEKGTSHKIGKLLEEEIRQLQYPRLRINRKKTIHLSKKHGRRITGITITNENELSLGRNNKRKIRSMIHRFTLNKLNEEEIYQLQGYMAFAKDVEPAFVRRMASKYGEGTISRIFRSLKPQFIAKSKWLQYSLDEE